MIKENMWQPSQPLSEKDNIMSLFKETSEKDARRKKTKKFSFDRNKTKTLQTTFSKSYEEKVKLSNKPLEEVLRLSPEDQEELCAFLGNLSEKREKEYKEQFRVFNMPSLGAKVEYDKINNKIRVIIERFAASYQMDCDENGYITERKFNKDKIIYKNIEGGRDPHSAGENTLKRLNAALIIIHKMILSPKRYPSKDD